MKYLYGVAHEQFRPTTPAPGGLAERAGFDGICCSDHLQPWWEDGEAGHAWVWLGAAGQATDRCRRHGGRAPGPGITRS